MPYFTYDTSVFISRRLTDFQQMRPGFLWSAVVLMELMAGARGESRRKVLEQACQRSRNDNLLIVPNLEDWLLASKILYLLLTPANARRKEHCNDYHQELHSVWRLMF